VLASLTDDTQRAFHLGWSRWRRAHQAIARRCHRARRAGEGSVPGIPRPTSPAAGVELADGEWERIRGLLPPQRPSAGRPRHDHRMVVGGIRWVLRTASPWREMPARFGKWNTAYVRFRLWRRQGLRQQIIDALGPEAPSPSATVAPGGSEVSL